jgi:hypothetical protein
VPHPSIAHTTTAIAATVRAPESSLLISLLTIVTTETYHAAIRDQALVRRPPRR